jgi:hypothetical protein
VAGQPVVTGNETHPVDDPEYWWVTHCTDGSCNCETCEDPNTGNHTNCIEGYVYDCKWDNYHIWSRCRPKGGYTEWINKDFSNVTGESRNDLHWYFDGAIVNKIVEVYKPADLEHVEFVAGGSPASTEVRWSGGDVADGATVHCGVKVNWGRKEDRKKFTRAPRWTLDGVVKEEVAGCGLTDFTFTETSVDVDVHNTLSELDPPLEVTEFSYAFVPEPLALSELTWNNPAIPWTPTSWAGAVAPGSTMRLGTIPDNEPGTFLVIQFAANFAGDPPLHAGHIIMQVQAESGGPPIPAASTWGLVVMTLLLLVTGAAATRRLDRRIA